MTKYQPKNQKRFIAGSICPHWGCKDSTVIYQTENQRKAECVECGWSMQEEAGTSVDKPPVSSHD